ncbi:hypothetical protein PIN31115_00266 [Pandoraea iniqua]|uniref:Uncharacterized protein n=1 Tax=Pandoraea iniqua TaxID=2508288 RepID=A0A5E4RMD3_9BURK|nr:hypothetical protein PIN31115_00266 [Pandoraea iniqua]
MTIRPHENTRRRVVFRYSQETQVKVGTIVTSNHIAVPQGAKGIVTRVLGDMAMVRWYAGQPGASRELNTEPFFIADLIPTGDVMPVGASSPILH